MYLFRFIAYGFLALLGATASHAATIYDYSDTIFNDHVVFSLPTFTTDGTLAAASLTTATSSHGTITGFYFHLVGNASTCSLGVLNSPCIDIFFGSSEIQSLRIALASTTPTVSIYTGPAGSGAVLTVTSPATIPEPGTFVLLSGTLVTGLAALKRFGHAKSKLVKLGSEALSSSIADTQV